MNSPLRTNRNDRAVAHSPCVRTPLRHIPRRGEVLEWPKRAAC